MPSGAETVISAALEPNLKWRRPVGGAAGPSKRSARSLARACCYSADGGCSSSAGRTSPETWRPNPLSHYAPAADKISKLGMLQKHHTYFLAAMPQQADKIKNMCDAKTSHIFSADRRNIELLE